MMVCPTHTVGGGLDGALLGVAVRRMVFHRVQGFRVLGIIRVTLNPKPISIHCPDQAANTEAEAGIGANLGKSHASDPQSPN